MSVQEQFRNYTGEDLVLVGVGPSEPDSDGLVLRSMGVARIVRTRELVYSLPVVSVEGERSLFHVMGDEDLDYIDIPKPCPGVLFIVSESVCRLMPDRDDFVYVSTFDVVGLDCLGRVKAGSLTSCSMRTGRRLAFVSRQDGPRAFNG